MSVPDVPLPPEPPGARRTGKAGLGGCLVVLFGVIGIVLLLPGVCSLAFMVHVKGDGRSGLGGLWLTTFVIAAGGILLIGYAWRNR